MKHVAPILLVVLLAAVTAAAQRPMPSHPSTVSGTGAAVREVARVNGVAVTSDRVSAALAALIPQESFHRNVSAEKMTELRRRALSSVIDDELEYQDGVRRGITASDAELKAAFAATVASNGGEHGFANVMRQAGTTEDGVRLELTRRIIIEKAGRRAVLDRCSVTRDEAQRYFTEHPERFLEPEQLHVFGITVGVDPSSPPLKWQEARRRADEARKALDAGASFANLARTYSTDPSRDTGGDMGFVHQGGLAAPFDDAVKALTVGTPSGVIESLYGYHILLVSEIRPPQRKTFDEVGATLIKDMSSKRCGDQQAAWVSALHAAARVETIDPSP